MFVASCKDFGLLVVDIIAFMHARTDEEIYVKAVSGTRKASKHWQEFSSDKLVTNMLFATERHQSVYLQAVL